MNYWLIKSEAHSYSVDDLKRDGSTSWTGVRNYQARNFMRDHMREGDLVLFYHSGGTPPAVVGVARVSGIAHSDLSALDKKSHYFDPKSTSENPIWYCVDVEFVEKFKKEVTLPQIKFDPELKGMMLAARGSRLSVQPVGEKHFKKIVEMASN